MTIRSIKTLKVVSLLLFSFALAGCNNESKLDFESFVAKKLNDFRMEENAQVISISLVNENDSFQKHFGQFPNGTIPSDETVYEIGSITKTYLGLLLAKAVLDKKISLDEDIRVYLNDERLQNLHYKGQPITVRHLANHQSGLPVEFSFTQEDIKQGKAYDLIVNYTEANFFNDLSKFQLTSAPGSDYQYSNVGSNLVGYILEKVYQKPLATLITTYITDKSGEQQTLFRLTPDEISQITIGTDPEGNSHPLLSPYSYADGGLTSTTGSMKNYMRYVLNSTSPEVALSQTLLRSSFGSHGQAYYWNTYDYDSDKPMLYNSGGTIGTSSFIAIYPKQKIGVFIVTNLVGNDTQGELNDIANDIVDKYLATPASKR